MNKTFLLATFFFASLFNGQQVRLDTWDKYASIRSFNGITIDEFFTFMIHLENNGPSQMDHWSLSVRLTNDITNSENKRIAPEDLNKFQFIFERAQSNRLNHDDNPPTAEYIGVSTSPIPFSFSEIKLVENSNYTLHAPNYYFSLKMMFKLRVEGGAYLEKYLSWQNYRVNMIAEVRNRKGQIVAQSPIEFEMQIHPSDSAPNVPTYSLTLNPPAQSVLLEFKTPNDYMNGVTEQQVNALSVVSETPYTLEVQSLSSTLNSTNDSLPIETINVSMLRSSSQELSGSATLSTAKQTILFSPAHTDVRNYDLRYKITPPNMGSGFFNKPYETYSANIVYSLTPQ